MKIDITRDSFDEKKLFTRVLMQQGRAMLDADFNEQSSILLDYIRTLARHLVGPYWGPPDDAGFFICTTCIMELKNIKIGTGYYYVDGIPVRIPKDKEYTIGNQPYYNFAIQEPVNGKYFLYLDAWEQVVTASEDDSIADVALKGTDTAARTRVVWQVKFKADDGTKDYKNKDIWNEFVQGIQPPQLGGLRAKVNFDQESTPCDTPLPNRYRGLENQLYRVEIHKSGLAVTSGSPEGATFKWSRNNASVLYSVEPDSIEQAGEAGTYWVTLRHSGRKSHLCPAYGDWVEVVETASQENTELQHVIEVDSVKHRVKLKGTIPTSNAGGSLMLRQWDQKGRLCNNKRVGELQVMGSSKDQENWIELEDGIKIAFEKDKSYQAGDYWLIPARTETGDIEGYSSEENSYREPHGIIHHYAPLAVLNKDGGNWTLKEDLRRVVTQLWKDM